MEIQSVLATEGAMAMEYGIIFAHEMGFGLLIVKGDLSVVYNTTMGEEGVGSTFGHIWESREV